MGEKIYTQSLVLIISKLIPQTISNIKYDYFSLLNIDIQSITSKRSIIYTKALIQSVLSQLPKKTHLVTNQYTKLDIITALQMICKYEHERKEAKVKRRFLHHCNAYL